MIDVQHEYRLMKQDHSSILLTRHLRRVGIGAALLVALQAAHATAIPNDGELALLPEYCQDAQMIRYGDASYNKSPRADHWVSLMGKAFWAMHHYCWALTNFQRSAAAGIGALRRKGLYDEIIQDLYYVINNVPKDFLMLPEIYLRVGDAELLRDNVVAAIEAFQKSAALKPDYWPAYTRRIDLLVKFRKTADAKALAAEGLQFAPQSVELIQRFRKLGGDPATVMAASSTASAAGVGLPESPSKPSGSASSLVDPSAGVSQPGVPTR